MKTGRINDEVASAPAARWRSDLPPERAPGGPVSMPIGWDELRDPELRLDRWHIRGALDRVRAAGDPLAGLIGLPQRLPTL